MLRLKVGDFVYSHTNGMGEVIEIREKEWGYPVLVDFGDIKLFFTITGRRHKDDLYPTIFLPIDDEEGA